MKAFWSALAKYAVKVAVWAAENPQAVQQIINEVQVVKKA